MADGVNISDITRSFSDQEWASLPSQNRRHVHEARECMRTSEGLLGISMQLRLLPPSQTNRPLPFTSLPLATIMEELAKPLALVAEPIVAGDAEEDKDVLVIDSTLLDTGH